MKTILFSFALILGLSACNKDAFNVEPVLPELEAAMIQDDGISDTSAFGIRGTQIQVCYDCQGQPCQFPEYNEYTVKRLTNRLQEKADANCEDLTEAHSLCQNDKTINIRISVQPTYACK